MDAEAGHPARGRGRLRHPVLAALLTALTMVGALPDARALDEAGLAPLGDHVQITDGSYRYDRRSRLFRGAVRITNVSSEVLATPVWLVVDAIEPAGASVVNAHGTTSAGRPYFDLGALIAGGSLAPGASSALQALEISNPTRAPMGIRFVAMGPAGPPPNNAPTILSQPPATARVGETWRYPVDAADDDGDALTFALETAPAGMTIDPDSGEALWTPAPGTAADQAVVVLVTDGRGGEARQAFDIVMLNTAPAFLSQPPANAAAGEPFVYDAQAEDADGDALTFALEIAPAGMTVDPDSGQVRWTPAAGTVGSEDVALTVSDGRGGIARQDFSLVLEDEPPQVLLGAPQSVQASAPYRISAAVSDDVGVVEVVFYVDGLEVMRSDSPPFRVDLTAPGEAGLTVTVRVEAVDGAGNTAEAGVTMPVLAGPDTEAPVIVALQAPATAAPGEAVTLAADVVDDRGVDDVHFFVDDAAVGNDATPPFTVAATIPGDATPGDTLSVRVEARDAAGNLAEDSRVITVVAAADTTPPSQVSLQAPAEAPPGAVVALAANAIDDTGVQRVEFRVDGKVVGEDADAPYALDHPLPSDLVPGAHLVLTARAVDFAGNATLSPARTLDVVSVRDGFVLGRVYDDTSGRALEGVQVAVTRSGGEAPDPAIVTHSDAEGRFRLQLGEGPATLRIGTVGHTHAVRNVTVLPGGVVRVLDARLTPLAAGEAVSPLQSLTLAPALATVDLPVGAFGDPLSLSLTGLSGQGLPAPLPPGWSPLLAFTLAPADTPANLAFELHVPGLAPDGLVVAAWQADEGRWHRIEATADGGGTRFSLTRLTTVVFARPDAAPRAPAVPAPGMPLPGVEPMALPDTANAAVQPQPTVLFLQPDTLSQVSVTLEDAPLLPSGTPVQVLVSERHDMLDDSLRSAPLRPQDLLLYQRAGVMRGEFPIGPSLVFEPQLLREGRLHLDARRADSAPGLERVGPAGGSIAAAAGQRLAIPAGALTGTTPVSVTPLDPAAAGLDDPRVEVLAGVHLDLAGTRLSSSATWGVVPETLPADDAMLLVVRRIDAAGTTHFELVAIATVDGDEVVAGGGGLGLSLPGLDEDGAYWLVRIDDAAGTLAWVTGTLSSGDGPLTQVLTETDTLPFVSIADDALPTYVLATTTGTTAVAARSLGRGAEAAGEVTIDVAGAVASLDLALAASGPSVLSVTPADGATGASADAPVTVRLSRAMDPASDSGDSVRLQVAGAPVATDVTLLADGVTLLVTPSAPLTAETLHTLELTPALTDTFGNAASGNQPGGIFRSTFTTADTTPPPIPDAGQIEVSLPAPDGAVTVTGSQGTLEPGAIVAVRNDTTGAVTSTLSGADGSFSLRVAAGESDMLTLVLGDTAGNETEVAAPPMSDGQGTAVLGAGGGTVQLPDGTEVTFPEGSLAEPVKVTVERVARAEVPVPDAPDFGLGVVAGLRIDTRGAEVLKPLKMRMPVSGDFENGDTFLVTFMREVDGETLLDLQETATYVDGYAVVNSPPFAGLGGFLLDLMILWLNTSSQLSFVTGTVMQAPQVGVLSMNHDIEADSGEITVVDVIAAVNFPEFAGVEKLQLFDKDGNLLAEKSGAGGSAAGGGAVSLRILHTITVNPELSQQVFSVVSELAGQPQQSFPLKATAMFRTAEGNSVERTVHGAVRIMPFGQSKPGRAGSTRHVHDTLSEAASPARGAFVEVTNGLGRSYPTVTTTSRSGGFVLAAAPGPGFFRVFDPLTGNGTAFPINIPAVPFDFTDVGTVFVPVSLGDALPPTLEIAVQGSLIVGEPFTVTLNATDDEGIEQLEATVHGQSQLSQTVDGANASESFEYLPLFPGEYRIDATAEDTSGNEVARSVVVTVFDTAPGSGGQPQTGGGVSLADGAENVDPNVVVYVDLAADIAGGAALHTFANFDAYFLDVDTGRQIAAIGGTDSSGERLVLRPASPLPLGANMHLNYGGDTIAFTTRSLTSLGVVGGFDEIRGVAGNRSHAYVADYAAHALKVVSLETQPPSVVNTLTLSARPRDVAVSGDLLVVVGGGQEQLPFLRMYDITNPVQPERLGTAVLFPLTGQAVPTNVRLAGAFAYVASIGPGVQVVDLGKLRQLALIPFQDREPLERNGQAAIVGGFRLPDPEHDPPLVGSAFDVGIGTSTTVIGGSQPNLYVLGQPGAFVGDGDELSAVFAGFNLIRQGDGGATHLDLGRPVQRLAVAPDFVVASDLNGDGALDYRNINLAAVSHGAMGISLVDLTRPDQAAVLGTVEGIGAVRDMTFVERYLFTGDRVVSFDDPAEPVAGNALHATDENGNTESLSNGGDVAVADFVRLPGGRRVATLLSSSGDRKKLQVATLTLTGSGRDWDLIRTTAYEPWIHPDNADYLHTGDPVNPFTGELVFDETDLAIPGRGLHFAFTRTYRSAVQFDGPLGHGWDHAYNDRLSIDDATGDVTRFDGTGRADRFTADGSNFESPRGVLATLDSGATGGESCRQDATHRITFADGERRHYEPAAVDPARRLRLECIEDRFGNALSMRYDGADRLRAITDSMGREIRFIHGSDDRIRAITDFAGRTWTYRYDYDGNLMSVTGPPTEDLPAGPTTRYVYSGGFPEYTADGEPAATARLNHNLLRVVDANGNEYLRNTWYPTTDPADIGFDRVWTQRLGDPAGETGGTFEFAYEEDAQHPGRVARAITTNRSGAVTEREYGDGGELEKVVEKNVTLGTSVVDLETRYTYDANGLIETVTTPRGMETAFTWSADAPRAERRSDLTRVEVTPAGGGATRSWSYQPGPYGVATARTDPEGHTTTFVVDARGLVTRVTRPQVTLPDGTTATVEEHYTWGSHGEILSHTSATGEVTAYTYHPACTEGTSIPTGCQSTANIPGYLASVTADSALGGTQKAGRPSPAQATTRFEYDIAGNPTRIEDPRGTATTYQVDALNRRTAMSDPRGKVTYRHDGNGSIVEEIHALEDLAPRTITRVYDALGLLRSETEAAGTLTRTTGYDYDASENRVLTRMPSGAETIIAYDERALPVSVRVPGPGNDDLHRLDLVYDEDGNVVQVTDGAGQVTRASYNGFNEKEEVEDGNGNRLRTSHDRRGLETMLTWLDRDLDTVRRQTFERDAIGRVREVIEEIFDGTTSRGTAVYQHFLDASGRPVKVVDPLGHAATYAYDGLDRPLEATDAAGNRQQWAYDGVDLASTTRIDAAGAGPGPFIVGFEHDDLGRTTRVTRAPQTPDARSITFEYDARDMLVRETVGATIVTAHTYDDLGRLATTVTGRDTTSFEYDLDDRLLSVADAGGNGIDYDYDDRNRVVRREYADGSAESFTWRGDDTLDTRTDRAGNLFTHAYDDAGRLEGVAVTPAPGFTGIDDLRYAYDALDQLTSAVARSGAASHTVTLSPDSRGAVLAQSQGDHTVLSVPDLAGRRVETTYPGGLVRATRRDAAGRPLQVDVDGAMLARFEFLGEALRRAATFGNGVAAARSFNAAWEETARSYSRPGAGLLTGFSLRRDAAGRVVAMAFDHRGGAGEAYGYTPESWLGQVTRDLADPLADDALSDPAGTGTTYGYDAAGNRTAVTAGGVATGYDSNATNQYTAVDGVTFDYDDNGNLRSDGRRLFDYDAFGNLLRVRDIASGTTLAEYAYDALLRRVRMHSGATVEQYVHDGDHEVAVLDGAGDTLREYVHAGLTDRPVALRRDGETFWYQYDHRGNVVAIADADGTVVERYRYDAFGAAEVLDAAGNVIADSTVGNPLRFAGRPQDPVTGLVYMRARDYDPALGRFLQPDPAGVVDGPHLYAYAGNDPLNFTDPTGLYRRALAEDIRNRSFFGWSLKDIITMSGKVFGAGRFGARGQITGATKALLGGKDMAKHFAEAFMKHGIGKFKAAVQKAEADYLKKHLKGVDPKAIDMLVNGANLVSDSILSSGTGFLKARDDAALVKARIGSNNDSLKELQRINDRARNGGGYRSGRRPDIVSKNVKRRSGCCCLEAGTPVVTADGTRAIEDLRIGDRVLSHDPQSGTTALQPVTALFLTEGKPLYRLELEHASGAREVLGVTDNHPFFVEDRGWTDAAALEPGARLRTRDGIATVIELTATGTPVDTFNVTVAGFHSYYAGAGATLMHNCDCEKKRRVPKERIESLTAEEKQKLREIRDSLGDVGKDMTMHQLVEILDTPDEPTFGPNAAGVSGTEGFFGRDP